MKRTRGALFWAFCAGTATAGAQSSGLLVDVGTASTRYADSVNATALSISPVLRLLHSRFAFEGSGTLSRLAGVSTNSGIADATLFGPSFGIMATEVQGIVGGSAHHDGSRTGRMLGSGRVRLEGATGGVFAGAGLGRTWDGTWSAITQADVGGWLSGRGGTISLSVSPTTVDDTIKYFDTFVSAHRSLAKVDFDASLGARGGGQLASFPAERKTWGSLALTLRVNSEIAVVAAAGTYPVDLTEGYPGGRFISVSLRLAPRGLQARTAPMVLVTPPGPVIQEFEARRVASDTVILRVRASNARTIEVSGDFTLWSPVHLRLERGGWWSVRIRVSSGTHEIALRADDGPWSPPPGLVALTDEFGGAVGRLSIPR